MNRHIETIEIHGEEPKEPKFPAAYEDKESGQVVLFYGQRHGVVIKSTIEGYCVGYYSSSWTPCTQTDTWEPVNLVINNPNALK